jgi:hypothetical protein
VSQLGGIRIKGSLHLTQSQSPYTGSDYENIGIKVNKPELLTPSQILGAQTSSTEIRGGQAGGLSSLEYHYQNSNAQSGFDALFGAQSVLVPINHRVRCVARKRHPLAGDLKHLFESSRRNTESQSSPLTGMSNAITFKFYFNL